MPESNALKKHEVAALMGVSERTVRRNLPRSEAGYAIADLPVDAQQEWAQSQRTKVVEMQPAGGQLALALTAPVGPHLSEEARAEASRRYDIIEPLLQPDRYFLLLRQFPKRGELVAYLSETHQVSRASIYSWLLAFEKEGLPGLAPKDRSDKGKPRSFNPAALDFILAAALPRKGCYGKLTVREIYRAYNEERLWRAQHADAPLGTFEARKYSRYLTSDGRMSPLAQLPEASYETFRTWFNRIPEVALTMARDGEEAFKNTQEILSFRSYDDLRPLDYVVMDHRRLDIFAIGAEGKLVRPWITAAIDMRTRLWLAWVIVESPSSDSIAMVMKRCFIDHGLPNAFYWDNGKDFTCEYLEGKDARTRQQPAVGELSTEWRGVLGTLGIRVYHAIVRNARAKLIEPNFGRLAKFDQTLPEWCGHKPGARPERFSDLLEQHEAWERGERRDRVFRTMAEVAALYDDAMHMLNERELEGEGMRKVLPGGKAAYMCPAEAWEVMIGRVERRTVPVEVLQFAFAKRKMLTIKHSEVCTTIAGQVYHYRLAGNQVALGALNGCEVELAYDPLDLGEGALYYQSRFVGLLHCAELRRMGEDAFREDEKDRRALRRETKNFIEAVHQTVPVADAGERLLRRRAVAPVRQEPHRIEAPAAVSPAVAAAAEAARLEAAFSFAGTQPSIEAVPQPPADDGGDFNFFA